MEGRDVLYLYTGGSRYRGKSNAEVFEEIPVHATWNLAHHDSVSGEGSNTEQTLRLRKELPVLLEQLGIKPMLDIPCGDFHWMQQVDRSAVDYIGGDIVPELINRNQQLYSNDQRKFLQLGLTNDILPAANLVFCRDCLVHLSLSDIRAALANLVQTLATWLLVTHFPDEEKNKDVITGGWHPLNFCLPEPQVMINEGWTEMSGVFQGKSQGYWEVSKIKKLAFLQTGN